MKCLFEVNTICRLCLRVSEKVYRLNNKHHKAFIESIIKIKQFQHVPTDDEYICYICNALLRKTFNFMQTVWNAQEIICVILKNTDKITKPMIDCIDRHNNGLNSVNLSSVVICDNVKFDSSDDSNTNTDIEESDLIIISSSSDEDKDLDKCNLDEAEVEIDSIKTDTCNLDEVEIEIDDVKIEISDDVKTEMSDNVKTEISDPLTKDFNTDVHDDPKPEPKKKIGIAKRITLYKAKPAAKAGKRKYQVEKDDDYQPDSTSHSEDSDIDSYDDEGKQIKRPKDDRVYPRKCDHCDYEVLKGLDHYRHYLTSHPNTEYPYKRERNCICSLCGKLCTKARIGSHEATHTTQKLKCKLCPNVYSNKIRLYRHTQTVHPKRKLTCDYCSKTFKTRNCITRHIRTHTGSKPFKCHICGDGFAHSGNRSIHIRTKHQNYKCVPKKQKRGQKVRRNKKHNSSDTENTSSNEKTIRRTKRKKTKTKMLK